MKVEVFCLLSLLSPKQFFLLASERLLSSRNCMHHNCAENVENYVKKLWGASIYRELNSYVSNASIIVVCDLVGC